MNSKARDRLRDSQSGIASLLVTMVLMIVISLIVLGFAQVSRREQQNTLDHQLSAQAFYAAESGINDAEAVISSALVQGATIPPKTSCTGSQPGDIYSSLDYNVSKNTSDGVKYTCLLVTTQVPDLEKTLGVDQEWVTPIYPIATDGTPKAITNLKFTWPPGISGGSTSLTDCPTNVSGYITNPTLANWKTCPYAALRIDLVPVPTGSTSRAALTSNDMVVFAYPSASGGTFTYGNGVSAGSTHQVFAKCNGSGTSTCTLDINGLTAPAGTTYYARVHMLYKGVPTGSSVQINSLDTSGADDTSTLFSGAQAQIDSTGKAQDVLRRVRVVVSLTSNPKYSPYALESRDSICKRYAISPGIAPTFEVPGSIPNDTTNPTCTFNSSAGSSAGAASIGDYNCGNNCGTVDSSKWYFDLYRPNTSNNPDSIVAGCKWDWGDGTPAQISGVLNGTPVADDCYQGKFAYHVMHNSTPNPTTVQPPSSWCHNYTITLTEYFNNGAAPATYQYGIYLPYGNLSCGPG